MRGSKLRELTEETDDFESQIAQVSFPKLEIEISHREEKRKKKDRKSGKAQNATLALANDHLQHP